MRLKNLIYQKIDYKQKIMKKIIKTIRVFISEVFLGFKISEENRHKSQLGKF